MRTIIALAVVALFCTMFAPLAPSAHAQSTYVTLFSFDGTDGNSPRANVLRDPHGNIYSTTEAGGSLGEGMVFRVSATGVETALYNFGGGSAGSYPNGIVRDNAGNLYGTCAGGGAFDDGNVFKVNQRGKETVLYSFKGGADGVTPQAGLLRDSAGNLYGTTAAGGTANYGTVFKVDAAGNETVLHAFTGEPDGANPNSDLVEDAAGNLYGTTAYGGANGTNVGGYGTVFKVDAAGNATVLYSFAGGTDGEVPLAGVIRDLAGNLYGTTYNGGGFTNCSSNCGTVFRIDAHGRETVLHSFGSGTDGTGPRADLIFDEAGNLYGTTQKGGANQAGIAFKLDKTGNETILFNFGGNLGGAEAGAYPFGALARDAAGNLYGTTLGGGANGYGAVFELTFP
jgi:uncharacterized repeat protein (TIGR03803 family)